MSCFQPEIWPEVESRWGPCMERRVKIVVPVTVRIRDIDHFISECYVCLLMGDFWIKVIIFITTPAFLSIQNRERIVPD